MISPAEMAPRKLGTWDGVFMPVSLNILGIILFLRFGFILGQAGLLGALFLLVLSYAIDTLTAMSLNAISTNGQVRGGGAYYLISRSLGPEFGGSIGLIFFAGQALNAAMNVLGFVETLTDAFGESRGPSGFLPEGPWYSFFYGSIVLLVSAIVCLVGSKLFARATLALALILCVAIISIPISSFTVQPFIDDDRGAYYTGWAWDTFRGNLFPRFTSGAAGSSTGTETENWQSVFGVLFPAVTGILAGASMSGDLRKPSKSIPKGTNYSLLFTFLVYLLSFVVFAGTIERESFYLDVGIVSDVALSPQVITFGALASTAFSALMGVMACGKVLQAIARDNLLPVLDVFAQGTEVSDTPIYAVLVTYIFCQTILFVDSVNTIAQLVTMTTLLTFGTLSFATCALKAGGAPSFRPSFKYWNIWTAAGGAVSCFGAMFFTDPASAGGCILFAVMLFSMIHFFSPPKPWGDVTRNITYHFVRKYLLRLDERKGHVKYWRPQILLLANNPRSEWNLIIFCNSLKKGALYVLAHVLKGEFTDCLAELRKQQVAWLKLVDLTGIKSFVDVVIAKDEREGARNLILSCGLGGMRPNIVVMGYPSDMRHPAKVARSTHGAGHRSDGSEITIRGLSWPQRLHRAVDIGSLPTDVARKESPIKPTTYVGIMEDSLALNKALAIAYGFDLMQPPTPVTPASTKSGKEAEQRYIDLWPVQIASPDADESHAWDTYTMVLHLGTILSFTSSWKSHKLRVSVFVEHASEVGEERKRIRALLDNLRIPASLRVFCLADQSVTTYRTIVHGSSVAAVEVDEALRGDPWWETLKELRRNDERRARAAAKRKSQATSPAKAVPVTAGQPAGATDTSRKQSKREQKLFGVSLPAEHLAFHKQNIRLGLAHPRARRDDGEDGSSDSDSDFEDELAMLSEDDDWLVDGPQRRGLAIRRASTLEPTSVSSKTKSWRPRAFSIGGSAGLPDDPVSKPLLGSSVSTLTPGSAATSYGTLSSSQRTATPETVRAASNGSSATLLGTSYASTDSSMTPRASMPAYDDRASPFLGGLASPSPSQGTFKDDEGMSTLKASERQKLQAELQRDQQDSSKTPTKAQHLVPPPDTVTPRPRVKNDKRQSSYVSSTASSDAGDGSSSSSSGAEYEGKGRVAAGKNGKERKASLSRHSRARSDETSSKRRSSTSTSPSPVQLRHLRPRLVERVPSRVASIYSTDLPTVSFNELPNKAQYLILNELIRINSSSATGVVLTALPAPEPGTSLDELKSLRYLEQLESLFNGGPPILGVHAKTLTMTMSL
uniref:Na-K-Cl cotransporter n=2 Tax=Kalmanozyma brasiliensis (strain GHG001) TaxID=1365824 RepID=V5GSD4_KALBG